MNVQSTRDLFKAKLADEDFAEDGNLELIGASFIADEPSIFGTVNDDWNQRELRWYLSQSLNVNSIPGEVPKIWKQVASSSGQVNSNYGWCVLSHQNGSQFERAIGALVENKNSRQAVMIYTRPTMHEDSKQDGMHDFMCTYATQLLIRKNKLHHVVKMRSNDVVHGFKGDRFWQDTVHNFALARLQQKYPDLEKGDLHWMVGSLHIYPRHFELVK
jgi:thymidylate synthase